MNRREALKMTASVTGFALTNSVILGVLNGCQPTGKPDWIPVFLSPEQIPLINSITDLILPSTNTPGALDVHIPEFIDLMLKDNYPEKDQDVFKNGLNTFQNQVKEKYGSFFENCSQEDKLAFLTKIDANITQEKEKSFYIIVKELTLLGFFTSEKVMPTMLNYNPVPGEHKPCIPLQPEDKVYVDNNV